MINKEQVEEIIDIVDDLNEITTDYLGYSGGHIRSQLETHVDILNKILEDNKSKCKTCGQDKKC